MVTTVPGVTLPHIRVGWLPSTTSQTFVRYNIYRREAGETAWTRIAWVNLVSRLDYEDYAVKSRVTYEYTVTVTTLNFGSELESAKPSPVRQRVVFDWTYVHDVTNPPEAYCAFYSLESDEESEQEVEIRKAWGRNQPTAFVGELQAASLRIRGLPDVHRGEVWETMRNVQTQQRTTAAIFCVRQGMAGSRYFMNATKLTRSLGRRTYAPTVELVETFFEEAV